MLITLKKRSASKEPGVCSLVSSRLEARQFFNSKDLDLEKAAIMEDDYWLSKTQIEFDFPAREDPGSPTWSETEHLLLQHNEGLLKAMSRSMVLLPSIALIDDSTTAERALTEPGASAQGNTWALNHQIDAIVHV